MHTAVLECKYMPVLRAHATDEWHHLFMLCTHSGGAALRAPVGRGAHARSHCAAFRAHVYEAFLTVHAAQGRLLGAFESVPCDGSVVSAVRDLFTCAMRDLFTKQLAHIPTHMEA